MRFALALVLTLGLAACASAPERPLSDAQIAALVQGQTTRTQVIGLLGEPTEIRSEKGVVQLVYSWRLGQTNSVNNVPSAGIAMASVEVQRREIVLSFDGGEVLREIERNTHTIRNGAVNVAPQTGS